MFLYIVVNKRNKNLFLYSYSIEKKNLLVHLK
jgi:hypothetical protein